MEIFWPFSPLDRVSQENDLATLAHLLYTEKRLYKHTNTSLNRTFFLNMLSDKKTLPTQLFYAPSTKRYLRKVKSATGYLTNAPLTHVIKLRSNDWSDCFNLVVICFHFQPSATFELNPTWRVQQRMWAIPSHKSPAVQFT